SGVGKTTLAQNLAIAALNAGHHVRFCTLASALTDLLKQESLPALDRRLRRYVWRWPSESAGSWPSRARGSAGVATLHLSDLIEREARQGGGKVAGSDSSSWILQPGAHPSEVRRARRRRWPELGRAV
ncbi:MAG TPA: hypothetical protein VE755_04360, partial [Myxococcales bacterium]|nr:hypothetical protein [Myxococcales bacterium]